MAGWFCAAALVDVVIGVAQQRGEVVQAVLAALLGGAPAVDGFAHIASVNRGAQHFHRGEKVQAFALRFKCRDRALFGIFQPLPGAVVRIVQVLDALCDPRLGVFAMRQREDFRAGQRVLRVDQAAQAGHGEAAFRCGEQPRALVTYGQFRLAQGVGDFIEVGVSAAQYGDVAVGGGALLFAVLVDDGSAVAHHAGDAAGQGLGALGFFAAGQAPQFHGGLAGERIARGLQRDLLGLQRVGEGGHEQVVDVGHQLRRGAPGLFQYLRFVAVGGHPLHHRRHQRGVGAAKAVNRLLDIAHPDHLRGQLRQL